MTPGSKVNIGSSFCQYKHFLTSHDVTGGGFGRGESRGDSHTFDLIKLFTYPHMPPGPFAGHMKGGRESPPRTWHSARESSMTRREEKHK